MYVIKTITTKDGEHFKGFDTLEQANQFWKLIVAKASDTVGRKTGELQIELYETSFPSETAAIGAVKSAMADCIRKVSLQPSNNLMSKVSRSGDNLVTSELLDKAQSVINEQAENFPAWAQADIQAIEELLGHEVSTAEAQNHIQSLYKISYRLMGRGGTFGYNLITNVADHLCQMLDHIDFYEDTVHTAVKTHVTTMKYVIAKDIKGDVGAGDWDALLVGLERVASKITGQKKAE